MGMKLYYSKNLNPRVAVAVARFLESPLEFIRARPRHPSEEGAFREINPNTLVPVLVEQDRTLWETDAIACRLSMLAQSDFWVSGASQPEFQMWISWSAHHFMRAGSAFYWEYVVKPMLGLPGVDQEAIRGATADFHRYAGILDEALSRSTWLVDGRLSYADFRVASVLPYATEARLPLQDYKHVRRWHDRLSELPAWREPFAGLA